MKKALVIIPTYNERNTIEKTVSAVFESTKAIPGWDTEVLVVDDTSPDKTYEFVQELAEKNQKLHLLVNGKKVGLGGAYLKGMDHAFYHLGADVVFEFDADLSHDPKKLPEFLHALDDEYDLVIGSRYTKGGSIPSDWGLHRKFLSVIGNLIIMFILFDFRIRDWTSGYRAITKRLFEAVHSDVESDRFAGYTFQIGFLHATVRKGFKVKEIPFHFKDRTIGKSKLGPEYIKNTLLYILKVRLQEILEHRVFKFVMVGGLGALVQLLSLQIWRWIITSFFGQQFGFISSFQLASFLSIEVAVISNFILSNLWTFADRKLAPSQIPKKFIQFNVASTGSILIQLVIATLGEKLIGLRPLFTLPLINKAVDSGLLFAVVGILLGMFWNFFAYNKLIWKTKTVTPAIT